MAAPARRSLREGLGVGSGSGFRVRVKGVRVRVRVRVKRVRVGVKSKGALCAYVIRSRVSYNQNDRTLSQNSLRYLSKANLPMAFN